VFYAIIPKLFPCFLLSAIPTSCYIYKWFFFNLVAASSIGSVQPSPKPSPINQPYTPSNVVKHMHACSEVWWDGTANL